MILKPLFSLSRQAERLLLDTLLPPVCLLCSEPIAHTEALCPACWKRIQFISAPFCAKCGAPFEVPLPEGSLCTACLEKEPVYDKARAAFIYDEFSKDIVLRFKHADALHAAPVLAGWLFQAGRAFWPEADYLIPVPLHRWRLFKRRYNQSALLAQALSPKTGIQTRTDLLLRHRATKPQGHFESAQRHKNVKDAFSVPYEKRKFLRGKNLVLIDDVLTTGATVSECARCLYEAGANHVFVLTLCRTRCAS